MAVSLIELGRGGKMSVGQVLRMQRNVPRRLVTIKTPSHETGPGRDRLERMVGVPSGRSAIRQPISARIPGPAYFPGEAPPQERVRRQTSPVDIYAMSETEVDPITREESRQIGQTSPWPYERRYPGNRPRQMPLYMCEPGVGQAEEAIVKEERILPPSRKRGDKTAPAPLPTIAKVGIGLAILAGLTTVYLGFRQVVKEGQ